MLARKTSTRPRKTATQQRSRATVSALVEATARILVRDGFDRASTNRIAEAAGVGIGSLYQYFPSKEALVAAVIERHNRDLMQPVREALDRTRDEPIERGIETWVAVAIEAHRIDPELHRVLAEQTPRTGELEGVELLNRQAYGLFRAYLDDHRDELAGLDLDMAAFICITSIEALTHNAVIHRPDILAGPAAARFVAETCRLVLGYLKR
jgi:AcrR family transcriptional regulator